MWESVDNIPTHVYMLMMFTTGVASIPVFGIGILNFVQDRWWPKATTWFIWKKDLTIQRVLCSLLLYTSDIVTNDIIEKRGI